MTTIHTVHNALAMHTKCYLWHQQSKALHWDHGVCCLSVHLSCFAVDGTTCIPQNTGLWYQQSKVPLRDHFVHPPSVCLPHFFFHQALLSLVPHASLNSYIEDQNKQTMSCDSLITCSFSKTFLSEYHE